MWQIHFTWNYFYSSYRLMFNLSLQVFKLSQLKKASKVADRILEVTPAQVNAASKYSSANSDNCSEFEFLKGVKILRQEVKGTSTI
ncbi:hypothetical protein TNCT_620451 [Trichonephila clavata]|uniref:Uncharacterized protein n=1 Tax=Trichonephila clavata TaxID=2740835 RepID=A0A8X6HQG1_TRICU|nr:hypothetical protein TNCT_620451 [Trichonephila clavata]